MARIALVDWANQGTVNGVTSWRPDIPTGLGAWAVLDLRDVGINKAVIYLKDRTGALPGKSGRFDFGVSWDTVLANGQRTQLATLMGITIPVGSTIKSVLGDLLLGRVIPNITNRRVIKLFDQVLFDQPVIQGGATDTFTRADNADVGSSWDLIEATALRIVSNMVQNHSGGATGTEMWNTDLGSVDHYSQCDVTLTAASFSSAGPTVRCSTTNGGTFYYARACPSCGDVAIGKRVGFSISEIASGGSIPTSGFPLTRTIKLTVNGSGLEAFIDGVSAATVTDTAITTSQKGGIRIGGTTAHCKVDNWDGNTLAAPPVTRTGSIAGTGTLTGTGLKISKRTASISGTGTIAATGLKISKRTGSISGIGTLAATGVKIDKRTGSVTGTGVLTSTGSVVHKRTATLTGTGVLTGAGIKLDKRTAILLGVGTLAAVGLKISKRTASAVGTGLLAAVGIKVDRRTASISGVGTIASTGIVVIRRTGSLSGTGTLAATPNIVSGVVTETGSITGVGTLTAYGDVPGILFFDNEIGVFMRNPDFLTHLKHTKYNSSSLTGRKP